MQDKGPGHEWENMIQKVKNPFWTTPIKGGYLKALFLLRRADRKCAMKATFGDPGLGEAQQDEECIPSGKCLGGRYPQSQHVGKHAYPSFF